MASSTSSLLNFLSPLFLTNSSSTTPKFPQQNPIFSPNSSTSNSNSTSLSLTTPKRQENAVIIPKKQQQQREEQEECPDEVISVVCPSLAFANKLYFRSAYNVQVLVDDNENEERLLNRFRREVMRAGVIQECKRRRFFENKQDEKKRKSREAAKRNSRRRRTQFRGPFPNKEEAGKVEKKEDDEDNWEMPDGDDAPF